MDTTRRTVLAGSLAFACQPTLAQAQEARLPDTEVTQQNGMSAWLIEPTRRYDHAVLGDDVEAGGFTVEWRGKRLIYRLPTDAVFEDRRVRLVDVDGDGRAEAVVVKAYQDRGAAIAIYRIHGDRIEPMAEGPAVGRRHRWLNPLGVAAFEGGREPLIAAVVTPHLSGSLRLYRLSGATLDELARIDGYTNHVIGSRDLDLGRVGDVDGDGVMEVVLPTLDRRTLAAIRFKDGAKVMRQAALPGRMNAFIGLRGPEAKIVVEGKGPMNVTLQG